MRPGVAVVGLGVGAAHARAYVERGCDLRWLYDLDRSRAEALAAELGAGRPADGLEQILDDPQVEAVSIASFDDAHFGQALEVLRAKRHLFVEKPLCRTLEEAQALKEAWSATPGLVLASNLILRAAPLYRWLGRQREQDALGEIYAFDGDYLYGRLHKITDGWRKDVENYSVMLGGGVHLVDLMLWITGERPVSVAAVGNRIATEGTAFRYLDFAAATFSFESGLVGRVTANFASVHRHQHVVRVFGTRAAFLHDDAGARLHESRDPETEPRVLDLAPVARAKGDLVPGFVEAIRSGAGNAAAAQHEFDVISVCAAADEALEQGRPVDVRYA